MPCQCTTPTAANDADTTYSGCGCETESGAACGCGRPDASDRERSLERVVMDLDQRLRKLEGRV